MELAASARSMAGWQSDTLPERVAHRQSSSTDRCWPTGAYQVDSASEKRAGQPLALTPEKLE